MLRTVLFVLLTLFVPAAALAQESPTEQARRDLINRAERLRVEGDHAQALELGTRAGQVRMTPSLRLLIAQEHQALGHTLDALDHAERCVREAETDPTMRNREAVVDECSMLRDQIAARVGRLTVRVDRIALAHVFVGEHELVEPLWNVPIPRMPGSVRVTATTPDGRYFDETTHVAPGSDAEVHVVFTSAPVASIASPSLRPRVASAAAHGVGAGPWILAGSGVVSFALAGLFWTMHGSSVDARDAVCDRAGCDPVAIEHDDRARTFTTATNIALGVGATAVVGAGIWLLVVARGRADTPPSRRAFLMPVAGGVLAGVEGGL